MKKIIFLIKNLARRSVFFLRWDPWLKNSWSQEGEDRLLERIFESKSIGFYIDIGAHHPMRFSNTYGFYRKGWRGINVDAMPGSMVLFDKFRPRDINIEVGVGMAEGELNYYSFNEPALNGFSQKLSIERNSNLSSYEILDIKKIKVRRLSSILEDNFLENGNIDFMSVDVEGLDLEVLSSNDWERFRPTYVLVEIFASTLNDVLNDKITLFMRNNGYEMFAKCLYTVFFRDSKM